MFYIISSIIVLVVIFIIFYIVLNRSKAKAYSKGYSSAQQAIQVSKDLDKLNNRIWNIDNIVHEGFNPLEGVKLYEKPHKHFNKVDIVPTFGITAKYFPNDIPNNRKFEIAINSPYNLDPITITPTGISDGYHTFDELYYYRMLYNANMVNLLVLCKTGFPQLFTDFDVIKSKKHYDNKPCYGGGWFIVVIKTPWGQISNHYKLEHWNNFKCREAKKAWKWDNHTMKESTERMIKLNNYICNNGWFPFK